MAELKFRSDFDVDLIQHMGSDPQVVDAARVSTRGELIRQRIAGEDCDWPTPADIGLIKYLMKNRHGTPFEHGAMTFFISAPIFVFREFHRHRIGWSYNEESGRYKQLDPVFYLPCAERALIQQGKPGHYTFVPGTDTQHSVLLNDLGYSAEIAYDRYERQIELGIAREVARTCLPVGIYSSMYATCNPRSLMAFLSLRTKHEDSKFPSYPQWEINQVADKMEEAFSHLYPITHEAFCENGRVCP